MRLDKYLVSKGFYPSREKAQFAIMQKSVIVDGKMMDKPSKEIPETASIEIFDIFNKFVSRGGLKLEKAILEFQLDFTDKDILDVGASTGGFTDCAVQYSAHSVFAVDVGTSQFHESLKDHPKIQFIENMDIRDLTFEITQKRFDFIVSDLSFISLTQVIPLFKNFLKDNGELVLLIKPQFEAGVSFLNKSGIVNDEKGYKAAIERVVKEGLLNSYHLTHLGISTLWEKNKNVEFLAHFTQINTNFKIQYDQIFNQIKLIKKSL